MCKPHLLSSRALPRHCCRMPCPGWGCAQPTMSWPLARYRLSVLWSGDWGLGLPCSCGKITAAKLSYSDVRVPKGGNKCRYAVTSSAQEFEQRTNSFPSATIMIRLMGNARCHADTREWCDHSTCSVGGRAGPFTMLPMSATTFGWRACSVGSVQEAQWAAHRPSTAERRPSPPMANGKCAGCTASGSSARGWSLANKSAKHRATAASCL